MLSLVAFGIYAYLGLKWTVIIVSILGFLVFKGKWENAYFERRGIKSLPTRLPFIGHMLKVLLQREHFQDLINRVYNAFPEEKYIGFRQFFTPNIMVKDLELIKLITIKDFDHFQDRNITINEDIDPVFGSNLAALKGQKWREMRAILSPAFTSSKMRGMFDFVGECGNDMSTFFIKELEKPENKDKGMVEVELKDIFTRYANDVIATSAFGLKVNSLENRDNEFYNMGKKATDFSGFQLVKFFALVNLPKTMKAFNVKFFQPEVGEFFRNLVSGTMAMRETQNIHRPDMIQILMDAKKGVLRHEAKEDTKDAGFATVEESDVGKQSVEKRKWTDDEITAQAIIFFFAGFDTSSTLLCFLGYELAKNPDIQKRLQQEIDHVAAKTKNNGTVTYNDLQHMKYMDMVVSETLRYWPPAIVSDRKCVKEYVLPPSNDKDAKELKLKVGDAISIPIYSIHHDPQHYKNPDKFDPERFSDENKSDINPLAYLPFGIGPRNCIGSRFALMEAKSVIFHLLKTFDMVITSKSPVPFVMRKNSFNIMPEGGFWIGFKPRTTNK